MFSYTQADGPYHHYDDAGNLGGRRPGSTGAVFAPDSAGLGNVPGGVSGRALGDMPALPYAARHPSPSAAAYAGSLDPLGRIGYGNPGGMGYPGGLQPRGSSSELAGAACAGVPFGGAGLMHPPGLPQDWHASHMVRCFPPQHELCRTPVAWHTCRTYT